MRAAKSSHDVTTVRYRPVCTIDLEVTAFFRKWGRDSSVLRATGSTDFDSAAGRGSVCAAAGSQCGVRRCLRECARHERRTLPVRCPMGSAIASGSRLELDGVRRLQVNWLMRPTGGFILYIYNNMLYDISIPESQISCMSHRQQRGLGRGAGPFPFAGAPDIFEVRKVAPALGAVWMRRDAEGISACPVWTIDGRCPRILARDRRPGCSGCRLEVSRYASGRHWRKRPGPRRITFRVVVRHRGGCRAAEPSGMIRRGAGCSYRCTARGVCWFFSSWAGARKSETLPAT